MKSNKKVLVSFILAIPYFAAFAQKMDESAISAMNSIEYGYFFKHL